MNHNWLAQFSATWDIFVSVKLPAPLRGRSGSQDEEPSAGAPELARPLMPLVGAALGLCVFLPAWFLIRIPGNPGAALVCGIALTALLEFATGGRGLAAFASYLEARWHGSSPAQAISSAPATGFEEAKSPSGMILVLSVYMLRASCVWALVASSHPSWFIVAFAGAKAVQAELAALPAASGGYSMIEAPERFEHSHWHFAIAAMLVGGLFEFPAALAGLVVAWLLAKWFSRLCLAQLGCANTRALLAVGCATECALLLLGVLLLG